MSLTLWKCVTYFWWKTIITFLNYFCPYQLTVFLVYCGQCNPVAPSLHWELVFPRRIIDEDLNCGKDVSRLTQVSHIEVQLEQVRKERSGATTAWLHFTGEASAQRLNGFVSELPQLSAPLKWSWKLNTDIQRPKSVAELQACLMLWGFRQELSLEKERESTVKHDTLAL